MWERTDNQEVGLEAAILERVRNSSLVDRALAPTMDGAEDHHRRRGCALFDPGLRAGQGRVVGERCRQR